MMMWTLLWTFMAMALYVMRPNSMRSDRRTADDAAIEKPTGSSDDNTPPPPPPSAM
ncbi:Small integral membrane protein 14 [Caenorhabditis elegans]|nr:Uncharacterized protein CELE_C34C12.4 [Caenorhabditis elegans]CAK0938833.1 Uncharacterized protein CELE_C34C12.4 [Caenorhabditis elegans]